MAVKEPNCVAALKVSYNWHSTRDKKSFPLTDVFAESAETGSSNKDRLSQVKIKEVRLLKRT